MNRTITAALVLAGLFACAPAGAEPEQPPGHPHRLQRLQTVLKLSDQQRDEIAKIFEETRPQLEALRRQGQELREKTQARLKAVLTAEQMAKYEKLRQERREKNGQKPGQGG